MFLAVLLPVLPSHWATFPHSSKHLDSEYRKSSELSANVQPGQAAMGMLMETTGEAESTPEFPQVSFSHALELNQRIF